MPETATAPDTGSTPAPVPAAPSAPAKTRVEKVNHYLVAMSTTLGIIGAIGTMFVWVAANFVVGDVEVQSDRPVEALSVKVYDRRGQEATYHTPRFQLMPGSYHLEVSLETGETRHADTTVEFMKKAVVPVSFETAQEAEPTPVAKAKKRWWQFWRKG